MTIKTRKSVLKLEELLKIQEAFDLPKKSKESTIQRTKIIRKLAQELGITERRLRTFWQDPQYLQHRIDQARIEAMQIRILLELERLLCWPMDPYLRLVKRAIKDLYVIIPKNKSGKKRSGKRSVAKTSTYKDKLYSLFSYGLDLPQREMRGNELVKKRAKACLRKWPEGAVAVHCVPITWEQRDLSLEECGNQILTQKKRINTLMLVADRHSPKGRVLFSLLPESFSEETAISVLMKLLTESRIAIGTLWVTTNAIDSQAIPSFPGERLPSEHFPDIMYDPPTYTERPISFRGSFSSEDALAKKISEMLNRIGT